MLVKPLIPDFDTMCQQIYFDKELKDSNNKNLIRTQKQYESSIQTEINQETSDLAVLEAERRFAVFLECKDVRILAITQKEFNQCIHKVQKFCCEEVVFKELTPRPFLFLFLMVAEICVIVYMFRTIDISESLTMIYCFSTIIAFLIHTVGSFLKSILSSLERFVYNEEDLLIEEIAKLLEQKYQF